MPTDAVRVTCSARASVADCAAVGVTRGDEKSSGPLGSLPLGNGKGVTKLDGPSSGGTTTTGGELRRRGESGPERGVVV